ncbi:unnamed protein product [Acanthoscelides obtectus]|uniref:Uncharacterized protein n=1 Tax=Acanthoscelides obtectus TaxID=200917 RepID=A0A9P0M2N3_ACAOB|nr:unnamed protein product [Acanthoscelides obtectus]CAK1659740.1 hypothetical protein AOBTE_LOCUS21650 [Acanthoscelides obtectus]
MVRGGDSDCRGRRVVAGVMVAGGRAEAGRRGGGRRRDTQLEQELASSGKSVFHVLCSHCSVTFDLRPFFYREKRKIT